MERDGRSNVEMVERVGGVMTPHFILNLLQWVMLMNYPHSCNESDKYNLL